MISEESEMKVFKKNSMVNKYVYLIKWSDSMFSWGTMSNSNDRIRKSSVLNKKLTGKYDRRVDYLILKIMYGLPIIYVFEFQENERTYEGHIKKHFNQSHCYRGFNGSDRREISTSLLAQFQLTEYYKSLTSTDRSLFEEYMEDVFFNESAWRPIRGSSRSWAWGDSLEPNFLERKLNNKYLETGIETVLNVKF